MPEGRNRGPDDEEFDPLTRVASEQTLAEKLLMDMGAALPDEDMTIAEYLIGRLDEKGYLAVKVEDVAYELERDGRPRARRAARPAGPGAGRHRRAQPARVPADPDRPPRRARPDPAARAARSSASS